MPRYDFFCPDCSQITELVLPVSEVGNIQKCSCGGIVRQDYRGKNIHDAGDRQYFSPIHSDALAISPDQVKEHRREFPDVKLDDQCRPVFETFRQHEDYLRKTGFQKLPQHKKGSPTFRKFYPIHGSTYETEIR